jgi:hypothetical protein
VRGDDFKDELLILSKDMGAERCENIASEKRSGGEPVASIRAVSLFLVGAQELLEVFCERTFGSGVPWVLVNPVPSPKLR